MSHSALAHQPESMFTDTDFAPVSEDRRGITADWVGEEEYRSFHVRLGCAVVRIETDLLTLPDWLVSLLRDLNSIAFLPPDWDSYGALPITQQILEHAFDVIVKLMDEDTPLPEVGATVRGGVEFEWHIDGKDLEVQVESPFKVHAYFYDQQKPEDEWEEDIGVNLSVLEPYIHRLTA